MPAQKQKHYLVPGQGYKRPRRRKEKAPYTVRFERLAKLGKMLGEPLAEVAPCPQPQPRIRFKAEPVGGQAIRDAVVEIRKSGRMVADSRGSELLLVRALADSLSRVESIGMKRGHALGLIVRIALFYEDTFGTISNFTRTYDAIAQMEALRREGRRMPVCRGEEASAEKLLSAFFEFTSPEKLNAMLERARAGSMNGTECKIGFVAPEMIRRLSGESQNLTNWEMLPD